MNRLNRLTPALPGCITALAIALCLVSCRRDDGPQVFYDEYDSPPDSGQAYTLPGQTPPSTAAGATDDTNVLGTAVLDGTNLNITTKSGQFRMEVGTNITPPMVLLKDLPINDKAQLVNCLTGPDAIFATYSTLQSEEESLEFYRTEIQEFGWEFQGAFELGGRQMLTALTGTHRLTITFQDSGDERVFHVMMSERRAEPPGERNGPPAYRKPESRPDPAPLPQD